MDEIATLTSGFTLGQVFGPAAAGVLMGLGGLISPTFGTSTSMARTVLPSSLTRM